MSKYCLGLDISTSVVGYCYSSSKSNIDHAGFVDVKKLTNFRDPSPCLSDTLSSIEINNVSTIIVEDTLSGFGGGRTSQQTIVKLAKCNAIVSYVIEELYKVQVDHVNVSTLRKAVFGKSREKGLDSKTFVKCNLENMLDLSDFIHYNSKNNYDKKNYDMLDAVVASLYHWYSLK